MSDCSFVVLSRSRIIFEGGDEKSEFLSKRSRRSTKANAKVSHPIFKEAASYVEADPFWIKILENASRGIFPKMFRYKDGILSFKQRTKLFSKEICQDDPELCAKNVQDFMRSNGFYSDRDNAVRMEEMNAMREEEFQTELEWKNIRSKKTKRLLISAYVSYLGKRYQLTRLELSNLINLTQIANAVGIINSSTVIMEDDQIIDITVLCYNTVSRNFSLDSGAIISKLNKAAMKKINDEPMEEEEIHTKSSGTSTTFSKSRLTDWTKFATILGKRMIAHNSSALNSDETPSKRRTPPMEKIDEDDNMEVEEESQPKKRIIVIKTKKKSEGA
jgi:hypothetical protein